MSCWVLGEGYRAKAIQVMFLCVGCLSLSLFLSGTYIRTLLVQLIVHERASMMQLGESLMT
jgi:hypothetical protein